MKKVAIIWVLAMSVLAEYGYAAEAVDTLNLEAQREEALKDFGSSEFPSLNEVRNFSKSLFSKAIASQSDDDLKLLASQANKAANLIERVSSQYSSYYTSNYRYDFIQSKVSGPHDAYIAEGNQFKGIRNQAYFNLGLKRKTAGESLQAFMFFNDAFRLSSFDCGKDKAKEGCMRWEAEQEMKTLLELEAIKSYVSWQ